MDNFINMERGSALFHDKMIASKSTVSPEIAARISILEDAYAGNIGVMPLGGLYGAAKFATACIKVAQDTSFDNDAILVAAVTEYQAGSTHKGLIRSAAEVRDRPELTKERLGTIKQGYTDAETAESIAIKNKIMDEINKAGMAEGEFMAVRDEDGEVHYVENLNMLDDIPDEELSIEGLRAKGLIDKSYNTVENKGDEERVMASVIGSMPREPLGKVTIGSDGKVESVECPYCYTQDVYSLGWEKFGCFECDKQFKVRLPGDDDFSDEGEDDDGGAPVLVIAR